jgi:hypothetical protein
MYIFGEWVSGYAQHFTVIASIFKVKQMDKQDSKKEKAKTF